MRNKVFVAVLAVLLVATFAWAQQVQTAFSVLGLPQVVVTAEAQTASVLATDEGTVASKRAHVISMTTVDGYPVVLLVRVQKAPNGLFVDVIGEASIGELTTRVSALELTGGSHPSPAEDDVDTAVLAAAAE